MLGLEVSFYQPEQGGGDSGQGPGLRAMIVNSALPITKYVAVHARQVQDVCLSDMQMPNTGSMHHCMDLKSDVILSAYEASEQRPIAAASIYSLQYRGRKYSAWGKPQPLHEDSHHIRCIIPWWRRCRD